VATTRESSQVLGVARAGAREQAGDIIRAVRQGGRETETAGCLMLCRFHKQHAIGLDVLDSDGGSILVTGQLSDVEPRH